MLGILPSKAACACYAIIHQIVSGIRARRWKLERSEKDLPTTSLKPKHHSSIELWIPILLIIRISHLWLLSEDWSEAKQCLWGVTCSSDKALDAYLLQWKWGSIACTWAICSLSDLDKAHKHGHFRCLTSSLLYTFWLVIFLWLHS